MRGTLFTLVADPGDVGALVEGFDAGSLRVRVYARADDPRHLLSLVRSGRDPAATRRLPGLLLAIAGGAILGGTTMTILAVGFDLLAGMVQLALPFGLLVGAFLGGFSAAMTGTESACEEVRALLPHVRAGSVLVSVQADDAAMLRELADRCERNGFPWRRRG
jgi:hypothetical protein